MLVKDILRSAREDYLDDAVEPYLWPQKTLLNHLNLGINEWCKETGSLRDHTTEAICKHLILANKHTYPMDSRITEIHNGYLDLGSPIIYPVTDAWLDWNFPSWRRATGSVNSIVPDYDQGYFRTVYYPPSDQGYWSGAVTFSAPSTIAKTGALFSSLLTVGSQVVISGTTLNGTTLVPATFTVATVAADSFTVSEAIADEAPAAAIVQKVVDTLWLTVSRLPLNQLTEGGINTETPEIRFDYHPYLVHAICREAYSKQDTDTYDRKKAADHRGFFQEYKRQARIERDNLRASEETMIPHPGAL